MLSSARAGLDYYQQVFSSYQFSQFRILEFPRYRTFAESFSNTVPYSEGAKDARLTVARVDATGKLSQVAVVPTHEGARNAVVTKDGTVYLAHSQLGKLQVLSWFRRARSKSHLGVQHDASKMPTLRVGEGAKLTKDPSA